MVDLHLHARNTRAMLQISWGLYLQRQFHFTNDYKIMYYARQLKSNSGNSQWIYKVNHKFLCILPCTSCSFSSAYWSLRTKLWPAISHRSWKIQILEWAHQTYFIQGNNISDYHIICSRRCCFLGQFYHGKWSVHCRKFCLISACDQIFQSLFPLC